LTGIFTHLPASDEPEQDAFTASQLVTFGRVVDEVTEAIGRRLPYVHAANSGGVLAHPDSWGTIVRPGVMAYGHYPDPATPRTVDLLPGLTLASRVSFVNRVRAGETVSYGRTWTAPRGHDDRDGSHRVRRWLQPPQLQPRPPAGERPALRDRRPGLHGPDDDRRRR